MEELRRKVKTGALNVVLTNEDDTEIGRFSFNPVDLNIIRRYEEVVANLEKMEVPEDATEKDILELSDRLEEQIDYLLNSKASKSVFAICNPLTLTARKSRKQRLNVLIQPLSSLLQSLSNPLWPLNWPRPLPKPSTVHKSTV